MSTQDEIIDSIAFSAVDIDDGFWSPRLKTNRDVTIEYQYEQLEASGTLENFRRVAAGRSGGFQGMWFQDSDAYKWIEAASYVLANGDDPDQDLKERVDGVIETLGQAQQSDGYLNTYFTLVEPENRWTNLHMMHELYCAGHLIEAAVAHHRSTGEESLLGVATDFADHIDGVFGDEIDGVPGHEEIELALVKLYHVTGTDRYLDLAEYFIDLRGKNDRLAWELANPDELGGYEYDDGALIPDEETGESVFLDETGLYDGRYAQAHEPLREQDTVEGHSVRAMYLFAAAADLVRETSDATVLEALERLWENMTSKRMYITGGIGPEERHEGFTTDYDLRNDAYAETCAAIGSIFWNQRMFELTGESKYCDLIERTLYNGFLAGVSADGTEFFYENPLESTGDHHRTGWFTCACCPPNVARLLASLGNYLYAQTDDTVYVNQYIGSTVTTTVGATEIDISQRSSLPWEETVQLDVSASDPVAFSLRLRIPEWCDDATVEINGESVDTDHDGYGYLELDRTWENDQITLSLAQRIDHMGAHPAVEADAGKVALMRGPLVYCLEAIDNDRPLHQYVIHPTDPVESEYRENPLDGDDSGKGVTIIRGPASIPAVSDWEDELYRPLGTTKYEDATFTAVPYFDWDNRAAGAMRVWIRTTPPEK